ncbi:Zn(II)2Cys6 transcription factor [Kocuria palustris]|nr:Zn(II)2Cys6 transcription factor [Kocuria palustris]
MLKTLPAHYMDARDDDEYVTDTSTVGGAVDDGHQRPAPLFLPIPPPPKVGVFPPYNPRHQLPPPVLQPAHPPLTLTLARRRMRVTRACDRCRLQKIKCLGTNPCVTCNKHKKLCTYTTLAEQTGLAPLAPPVKRPKSDFRQVEPFGLPQMEPTGAEYVRHLENRVQYLELLLSPRGDQLFAKPESDDPMHPDMKALLLNESAKWRYLRRHQNSLINALCKQIYSQLLDELKAKVSIPRMQYFAWNMSGTHYLLAELLPPTPSIDGLFDEAEYLNYFFQDINPLFAIIHEQVFRDQVVAYHKLMAEADGDHPSVDDRQLKAYHAKLFSAILMLCYVLAIRMKQMLLPNPLVAMLKLEERLFKYAHKVILVLLFEWELFELCQGWLLITMYLRIAYRQTLMYHALGQAIIMCKLMGLGLDLQQWIRCTPYEEVKARRVFWLVYSMDRCLGLQLGKYCTLRDEDRGRNFPPMEYPPLPRDLWITLPAFAMIQILRLANFVHTSPTDVLELGKLQQINTELYQLSQWLDENGFANANIIKEGGLTVYAQVKLNYYDLVLTVHGKLLYLLLDRHTSKALKITMVVDAMQGTIDIVERLHRAGKLFTPWWLTMLLLFNNGIAACCLIHGGTFISQAREILHKLVKYLKILRKSPVRDELNKLIVRERFKMVKECIWAVKMTNHILLLRLQEDMDAIKQVGIDHGLSDVNQALFSQLGVMQEDVTPHEPEYQTLLGKDVPVDDDQEAFDDLLLNLQWFDQWGDFSLVDGLDKLGDNGTTACDPSI